MVQLCNGDDCWLWRYAGHHCFWTDYQHYLSYLRHSLLGSLSGLVVSYYTEVSKHYSLAIKQDKQKLALRNQFLIAFQNLINFSHCLFKNNLRLTWIGRLPFDKDLMNVFKSKKLKDRLDILGSWILTCINTTIGLDVQQFLPLTRPIEPSGPYLNVSPATLMVLIHDTN